MQITSLIKIAGAMALAAAVSFGQIPKIINAVRRAEFELIQKTKASGWPKAPMLPKSGDVGPS